jgi:hypothetical protein
MSCTHENGQPFLAVRQNSCSVRAFVLSGAHTELNFRFDVENSAISEWNPAVGPRFASLPPITRYPPNYHFGP